MALNHINDGEVARSETARDINRSIILNLIRRRQPISRADLARASGLQRSTVSLITDQLIHEQWVVSGCTGRLPRGRHPTFLQLNDRRAIIAVDLRPTQSSVAISDVNGRFLAQQTVPTPSNPEAASKEFSEQIRQMIDNHPDLIIEGIGVSVPGRFDESRSRVIFAPNLKWPEFDLKEPLERTTGLQVDLENAANACVLAEVWFGPVETPRNLVVVTVSEGLGVGIFVDGRLLRGANGMAGEFGHIVLDTNGPTCGCGSKGCWEAYASNWAALRYYQPSDKGNGPSFLDLLSLAKVGDLQAGKALHQMARQIGRGMRTIIAALSPEEIVLIGEFTRLWSQLGPVIESEVAQSVLIGKPPRIRPAGAEPSVARLRGTVALVLQKHFGERGSRFSRPRIAATVQ